MTYTRVQHKTQINQKLLSEYKSRKKSYLRFSIPKAMPDGIKMEINIKRKSSHKSRIKFVNNFFR